MVFGLFGGKKDQSDDEDDQEMELVNFNGPLNGRAIDLAANARLVQAGLLPAKELISDALFRRAELIRIDPKGDRSAVLLQVDGVNYPGGRLSKQQTAAVVQVMKLMSGLEVRLRGKPQKGGLRAELEGTPYELTVDITPVAGGAERLTVRARNLKIKLDKPEDIGFSEEMKNKIRERTSEKRGLVIACGPPNSGTTTTCYGIVRCVDMYLYAVFSLTDIGSRGLDNVTPFEAEEGHDLKTSLGRISRLEGDIVFINPLDDEETVRQAVMMADEICMISEMTAKDVAHGIAQLVKISGDAKAVSEGLGAIVGQRLIRKLCDKCKQAYRPNPKILAKVNLPDDTKVLYRKPVAVPDERGNLIEPEPCPQCGGIGYFGRTAMFEMIEMTDTMKEVVASTPQPEAIKAQARKEGMPSFQRDAMRLVAEGKTSLEEVQRAFQS